MNRQFRIFIIFAIGMIFLFPPVLEAKDQASTKVITYTITYPKDESNDAIDYTIGIPFLKKEQIDQTRTTGKFFDKLADVRDERPRGGNGLTLFFENKNGTQFKPGSTDTITIYVLNAPAEIRPFKGTSVVRKQMGAGRVPTSDNLPLVGWKVEKDPEYTILNDLFEPFAFTIQNLQFLMNVAEFPDPSAFLDFDNSFGFSASEPSFFVEDFEPGSDVFHVPGIVDEGNWFYARGKLLIDDVEVSRFVHGDQVLPPAVPEPSTLFLLGGALVMAFVACLMQKTGVLQADNLQSAHE